MTPTDALVVLRAHGIPMKECMDLARRIGENSKKKELETVE